MSEVRDTLLARLLTPHSSRTFWDRWTHPDSFRGRMLDLEEKINEAKAKLGAAITEPTAEVAAIIREWWASQPGMPYTAPSLWDAEQMAAA